MKLPMNAMNTSKFRYFVIFEYDASIRICERRTVNYHYHYDNYYYFINKPNLTK